MNDPDDILQDYFAECREHLAGIENDLLAIEQGGAGTDEELLNKVFRAAHSIKGGAGFFDLNEIRELAHKTENVLDLLRSRQAEPTPDLVSVLLQAFDKLRELIDCPAHADPEGVAELVARLEDLASSLLPNRKKNTVRRAAAISTPDRRTRLSATAFDFDTARKGGKTVYLLEYDLLQDVQRKGRKPLEVIKELMSYGAILNVAVDIDSVGTLEESPSNRFPMDILYATALGPELIGSVVELLAGRVWKVARNGECEALPGLPGWEDRSPEQAPAVAVGERAPAAGDAAPIEQAMEDSGSSQPKSPEKVFSAADAQNGDATVRLNVGLLDALMNLAGELVLGRNQLGDAIAGGDPGMIHAANQRISIVTSEVQETVMRTRMQPVGNLFQKFPRVVRDTARKLGKDVRLVQEGSDVELDKTIIEGLSDPLTHMVRNAIDHGIEPPSDRTAKGKAAHGTLALRAWHEAGLVVVEVADDGRGLDAEQIAAAAVRKGLTTEQAVAAMREEEKLALIFLPGLSTAKNVSDISGRGVGLDVVKTNLDRLGGKVEIHSKPGQGAGFRIKLPLTLAIIPSLLVQSGEDPVAIPLVNVQELVRIPASEIPKRIDQVGSAAVFILRDGVLPMVELKQILDLPGKDPSPGAAETGSGHADAAREALNVVVLSSGSFRYGLVVQRLHGTVEIVVKPLGRHLKHLREYAGATILGDGRVALILDVAGMAAAANLRAQCGPAATAPELQTDAAHVNDTHHLLLFRNASDFCAVPLHAVARVAKVNPREVELAAGRRILQHRRRSMPLVSLAETAAVEQASLDQNSIVVVMHAGGREFGVLGEGPVDVVEAALEIDPHTLRQPGVMGSVLLRGKTMLVLDASELAGAAWPGWRGENAPARGPLHGVTVLVAEDSAFFREHVVRMLEAEGAAAVTAVDGQAAFELLQQRAPEIQLVVTDIEMPRMDGLELTRKIRAGAATSGMPVVMLTSLAGEDDIRRGREAGATAYCIKLDRDLLIETLRSLAGRGGKIEGLERLGSRLRDESRDGEKPLETALKGERQ